MSCKSAIVPDPTAIGNISSPPFACLPGPSLLFSVRAARLRQLAETSNLAPYLRFLADLAQAQHDIQAGLPLPNGPDANTLARAREFAMPQLDRSQVAGTRQSVPSSIACSPLLPQSRSRLRRRRRWPA